MANEEAGVWGGKVLLDISNAMAGLTSLRQEHLSTFSAMGQAVGTLNGVGNALVNFGKKTAGALIDAGKAWGEFERKVDYIGAIAEGTDEDIAQLSKKIQQLGADTIYTNTEIADGFIELAKAGVSARDIIDGVGDGMTYLGAAAEVNLDKAATIMMSVVQTWGMGADKAVSVADRLSGAANASMVDIEDLGVSLKYAGSIASSLGIEFDDVNTALGLLGERSIRGSTAGTSLRMMMISLMGKTKPAIATMEKLGIITEDGANRFFKANGEAKDLASVITILGDSLDGLDAQEKQAALKKIFDIRALPSVLTLLDQGAEGFERMGEAIDRTIAAEIAAERLDNLSGDIEYLTGEIDNLYLSIGYLIANSIRPLAQALEKVAAWFNGLSNELKGLLASSAAIAAGISLITGGLFKIAAGAIAAIANLGQLIVALNVTRTAAGKTALSLGTMFKVGGIGLIVTLIAGLVAGLVLFFTKTEEGRELWAKFQEKMAEFWAIIQPIIEKLSSDFMMSFATTIQTVLPILANLATTIGEFLGPALEMIMPIFNQLAEILGGLFTASLEVVLPILTQLADIFVNNLAPILPLISDALQAIVDGFSGVTTEASGMEGVGEILAGIFDGLMNALPIVIETLTTILLAIVNTIVEMIPVLLPIAVQLFTSLITALVTIIPLLLEAVVNLILAIIPALIGMVPVLINAAIQLFSQLITAILLILPLIVNALILLVTQVLAALVGAIPQLMLAAVQLFMALVEAIPMVIPPLIEALITIVPMLIDTLVEAIPLLLEAATELFMSLIDAALEIVPELIGTVIGLLPVIIASLIGMIPGLIIGAVQLFMAIVEALPMIITELIPAILGLLPTLISTVLEMIPDLLAAAVELFLAIVKAIPEIIGTLVAELWKMGEQLMDGLADGIVAAGGKILEVIGNVVTGAIDWAKGLLGIASPSKVFRKMGEQIGDGLVEGISGSEDKVEKAMGSLIDKVKKDFQSLADDRDKAIQKLADLEFRRSQQKKPNASLNRDIEAQKKYIRELNVAIKKESAAIKALNKANKDLLKFAKDRDLVTEKLDAARKNLEKLQNDQATHFADFTKSSQSSVAVNTKRSSEGMIYAVEEQIARTKEFNSLIKQLQSRGLDQASLDELITQFMDNGSMVSAKALADSSDESIKKLVDLRKQLGVESKKTATTTGSILYDAGIEAAQGLVDGLESQLSQINAMAKKVADALTSTVKKQLGIKSPSREMIEVGSDVIMGLVGGLAQEQKGLDKELSKMAATIAHFNDNWVASKQFELETLLTMKTSDQASMAMAHNINNNMQLDEVIVQLKKLNTRTLGNTTYEFGDIMIPLKDLESIKTLEDFMDLISVYKRQRGM